MAQKEKLYELEGELSKIIRLLEVNKTEETCVNQKSENYLYYKGYLPDYSEAAASGK